MTLPPDSPRPPKRDVIGGIVSGDKRAIAQLFNLLEDRRAEKRLEAESILDSLFASSLERGHVVGVTGPPGAGKSSLLSRFIQHLRAAGRSVGVIAVDPSSRASQGALLGDRVRFQYDAGDAGVFVRSMANRGDYGGMSDRAFAGSVVLRAAYDVALLETVGVGQSESDVATMADTTMLVIQPGSGDLLQYLKAGIMEQPHLLVVNKADMPEARRTFNDVRAAVGHFERGGEEWKPELILASAQSGEGIADIWSAADRHREFLRAGAGGLGASRRAQAAHSIVRELAAEYGRRGLACVGGRETLLGRLSEQPELAPFRELALLSKAIEASIASSTGREQDVHTH